MERAQERYREERRREDELATLASHLSAATARWLELADGATLLAYKGERDMAVKAAEILASDPL